MRDLGIELPQEGLIGQKLRERVKLLHETNEGKTEKEKEKEQEKEKEKREKEKELEDEEVEEKPKKEEGNEIGELSKPTQRSVAKLIDGFPFTSRAFCMIKVPNPAAKDKLTEVSILFLPPPLFPKCIKKSILLLSYGVVCHKGRLKLSPKCHSVRYQR